MKVNISQSPAGFHILFSAIPDVPLFPSHGGGKLLEQLSFPSRNIGSSCAPPPLPATPVRAAWQLGLPSQDSDKQFSLLGKRGKSKVHRLSRSDGGQRLSNGGRGVKNHETNFRGNPLTRCVLAASSVLELSVGGLEPKSCFAESSALGEELE